MTLDQVKNSPWQEWPRRVRDVMRPKNEPAIVSPRDRMSKVLERLGAADAGGIIVASADRVVGIVTRSDLARGIVRADGNKAIVMAPNANAASDDRNVVRATITAAPADSVLAVDLEIPSDIVASVLDAARQHGLVTIVDPSPAERMEAPLFALADYVTPNRAEAEPLTGMRIRSIADAFEAGRRLVERGTGTALVKMGGEGTAVVDVSHGGGTSGRRAFGRWIQRGPGMAFTGALAVALCEGRSPSDAARFTTAAAAVAVTGYGSQPASGHRADVEAILNTQPAESARHAVTPTTR